MAIPKLTPAERVELAKKIGSTPDSVYMFLSGKRVPSANMAVRLNQADKRLRLEDMRPHDYDQIWLDYARKLAKENKA